MKCGFGKSLRDLMRPIQIVCVVHTIPEAHAVHSSTYGRKDAIFGILYSNTVGRNFREFGGGVKIYGRIRFADATDIARQSTISDYRESQLTPILDMSNRSAVSGARSVRSPAAYSACT